jgi:hypothetical protein
MNIVQQFAAEVTLAAIFMTGAAVAASPTSLSGQLLDNAIELHNVGYVDCVVSRYFNAKYDGWIELPGDQYLMALLARMDCGLKPQR